MTAFEIQLTRAAADAFERAAKVADEKRAAGHEDDCPCALCGVARSIKVATLAMMEAPRDGG